MVMGDMELSTEVLVIGNGPGGYGAAFRAADLGLDVTMVDQTLRPGGICLYNGCIPSKAYLFLAGMIIDARRAQKMGVKFSEPEIDLASVRKWKDQVIDGMADGLMKLSSKRGVQLIQGKARFENSTTVRLDDSEIRRIRFRHAIIATGSRPLTYSQTPFIPGNRIMSSAGALALTDIPQSLLVIGGGYVGLELGSVYAALGSKVSLVERENQLLSTVDRDLVLPLQKRLSGLFERLSLQTQVASLQEIEQGVNVILQGKSTTEKLLFDRVLVAIGRQPNSDNLGIENTKVGVNLQGFIEIDDQQRTADRQIFAVGDVTGGIMLAHKATREGRVAAEVIGGHASSFDVRAIPAVVYTDPQIAWCGLTEEQARKEKLEVTVQKFPWKYSGRASTMDATDGFTKLLTDPQDGRILGVGIAGRDAEGLISEGVLAIEMGALAEDIALSLHPHPTLSETEGEAAEIFMGSPTHMLPGKKQ